jgi:uncharacterized protein YoxC
MASFGKKILSAFVEMQEEDKPPAAKPSVAAEPEPPTPQHSAANNKPPGTAAKSEKFSQYFDKLFREANLPGPDYFEFSKMIEAMSSIPDERSRYSAAFAGLSVQGLDKQKLLTTAAEYLRILEKDAANFNSTVDATLHEKVHAKQQEIEAKTARIAALSKEIDELHQQIATLNSEIKENVEKIEHSSGGYKSESERMRSRITNDMEKIKQFI